MRAATRHWMSAADPRRAPSPWWYFRRAVYVSRRDYWRIFKAFVATGTPIGAVGFLADLPVLFHTALFMVVAGLGLLAYSLLGLYRMYGHPAGAYFRRLLRLARAEDARVVADLHLGTYRHSFQLADLLPAATIHSIDVWNVDGAPAEAAVQDVRDLEVPPSAHPRIRPARAQAFRVPLETESCDLVVLGFGTHEIPSGAPRETLLREADRILKPGGRLAMFEHGYDLHNYMIFGPVIDHVTRKETWIRLLGEFFDDVRSARTSHAVDLFTGARRG
jgi:SAM-dependent methyltransferase